MDYSILQEGLADYGVVVAEAAILIKLSRAGTTAFLITFNRGFTPESVKIPGEEHNINVCEYQQ